MPRFILFVWHEHFQAGGWNDMLGIFDTVALAHELIAKLYLNPYNQALGIPYWQIIDFESRTIVEENLPGFENHIFLLESMTP